MTMDDSDSDVEIDAAIFEEPKDFRPPDKEPTFATHTLLDGHKKLQVRLIGSSPLWGHFLWNAGRVISNYLEDHAKELIDNKTVMELGAGAALPGLICAAKGARLVLLTDYPEPELINNIDYNIKHSFLPSDAPKPQKDTRMLTEGYIWGRDTRPLLHHLGSDNNGSHGYDLLILSDLIFNHSQHQALLSTLLETLSSTGKAIVFFSPHRPWLLENDLSFFKMAEDTGRLVTKKVWEEKCATPMFEVDRGDVELRRTVFGYEISWKDSSF